MFSSLVQPTDQNNLMLPYVVLVVSILLFTFRYRTRPHGYLFSRLSYETHRLQMISTLPILPQKPMASLVPILALSHNVPSSSPFKESIAAEIERSKSAQDGDAEMTDEALEDPVPELTKRHFEEAMGAARRSVSDVEVRRYEAFAQQMKQAGGMNVFRFPTAAEAGASSSDGPAFGDAGNDDSLYE